MAKKPVVRKKRPVNARVNPQTGEAILSGREIVALERGSKERLLGAIGEDFVHKMHPHWRRADPLQEGYDFIKPRSRGNQKVEVKTLGLGATLSRSIHFKVRQGHWHNQAADLVLVVSPAGVYEFNASKLRLHIKNHLAQLPELSNLSYQRGQAVWVEFSLERLLALKIGHQANINPRHCRNFFLEKLRLKQRKSERGE